MYIDQQNYFNFLTFATHTDNHIHMCIWFFCGTVPSK